MPGAIIHTVTHTVVNGSGDGLWRTLGPAIIGAFPAVVALWFANRQSLRSQALSLQSNELAREQLKASNDMARRQSLISERQALTGENNFRLASFDLRYSAWQEMREAANNLYGQVMAADGMKSVNTPEMWAAMRAVESARLRVKMVFGEEVSGVADRLKTTLNQMRVAQQALNADNRLMRDSEKSLEKVMALEREASDIIDDLLTEVVARHTAPVIVTLDRSSDGPEASVAERSVED